MLQNLTGEVPFHPFIFQKYLMPSFGFGSTVVSVQQQARCCVRWRWKREQWQEKREGEE